MADEPGYTRAYLTAGDAGTERRRLDRSMPPDPPWGTDPHLAAFMEAKTLAGMTWTPHCRHEAILPPPPPPLRIVMSRTFYESSRFVCRELAPALRRAGVEIVEDDRG